MEITVVGVSKDVKDITGTSRGHRGDLSVHRTGSFSLQVTRQQSRHIQLWHNAVGDVVWATGVR